MNTTPTHVAQNVHAFTQEARDAVYHAIFSRRDCISVCAVPTLWLAAQNVRQTAATA